MKNIVPILFLAIFFTFFPNQKTKAQQTFSTTAFNKQGGILNPAFFDSFYLAYGNTDRINPVNANINATGRYSYFSHPNKPLSTYISGEWIKGINKITNANKFLFGLNTHLNSNKISNFYSFNFRGAYYRFGPNNDYGFGLGSNFTLQGLDINIADNIFFIDGKDVEELDSFKGALNFSVGSYFFCKLESSDNNIKHTIYGGFSFRNLSLSSASDFNFNGDNSNLDINLVPHTNTLLGFLWNLDDKGFEYLDFNIWIRFSNNPKKPFNLNVPLNYVLSSKLFLNEAFWVSFGASSNPFIGNFGIPISLRTGLGYRGIDFRADQKIDLGIGVEFFSQHFYNDHFGPSVELNIGYYFNLDLD